MFQARAVVTILVVSSFSVACSSRQQEICSPILSERDADQAYLKGIDAKPPKEQARLRAQYAEFCLQKWAYILGAQGKSSEPVVADAVMGACGEALDALNWAEAIRDGDKGQLGYSQSPLDGQSVSRIKANWQRYRQEALFFTVQARAGECSVPG